VSVLDTFRSPNANTPIPILGALDSFRNPPAEDENLSIEPQIGEPTLGVGGDNPDLTADYIFCNNLSVKASGLNNSLNLNWIAPPIQPLLHATNHELGIWNGIQGDNNQIVVFSIYESVSKPGYSPMNGGQYTRLVICPSSGGGPFAVTTQYSISGGQPRGIDIAPSDLLRLGSQNTTAWTFADSNAYSANAFVPLQSGSYNIGSPQMQVYRMFVEEYHLNKYNDTTDWGSFLYNSTGGAGAILMMRHFASGAPNGPGPGKATLYFVPGTTGGTLRLVVKAGDFGVQTTILDNIPQ
jgi:hypothetical protein